MAAAMGLSLAGERTTLFISGADLGAMPDLLTSAVERHLPLVIHMTTQDQNHTLSGGDDAISLAAQSGCTTLVAESVQQAVDFTLIARRVAEMSLTPVVVAIDSQQTAISGQNVTLPTLELISRFVGRDDDEIKVSNSAQRVIFGENRRRVPRWHDLDRPSMNGALHNSDTMGLLAASREQFFGHDIEIMLDEAMTELNQLCGRDYSTLSSHAAQKADCLIITEGSAIRQVQAIAASAELKKLKVGVVGLYSRQPINRTELVKMVAGKRHIVLLEQQSKSTNNSPLYNEIRAILDVASAVNGTGRSPSLSSVIYGLGGLPLLQRDLSQLIRTIASGEIAANSDHAKYYLGLSISQSSSRHPKRQVLLDTLQREFPHLASLGINGEQAAGAANGNNANTIKIALYRGTHSDDGQLINEMGSLIQQSGAGSDNGSVRTVASYPELKWQSWGNQLTDRLFFREAPAKKGAPDIEADAESPIDLAIVTEQQGLNSAVSGLSSRGILLVSADIDIGVISEQSAQREIYRCVPDSAASFAERELLMGAIFGLLTQKEWLESKLRPLSAARESHFVSVTADEIENYRESFKYGFDQVALVENSQSESQAPSALKPTIPLAVRHLGASEESAQNYASLPRFWDQVGMPYRNGEQDELTADPYLATNTIPPLTSTFNSYSKFNLQLPVFIESNCTACGDCWGSCPDSAIGVSAITPKQFVESAISSAGASALRPLAAKIAGRMTSLTKEAAKDDSGSTLTMGDLLLPATAWVCEKGAIEGDRLSSVTAASEQAASQLGAIQVAVTDSLFTAGEASQKDGGALLALAINPDACKGCGLCIERCETEALAPSSEMAAKESAQIQWQVWEQLPDTDSGTIERVSDSAMDPIAARMLSRYCAFPMAGGDSAEPASGSKVALRMALASLEYHQQPLVSRFIEKVGKTHQQVTDQIRELLNDALPTSDLSQLSSSLATVEHRQIDLGQLNSVLESGTDNPQIDATRLKRLLEIANSLGDLHWRLSEGEQGLGRSRYSLVTAPGHSNSWAATYPYNPFQVPTLVENGGDAPQLAAGLISAQVRKSNEAIGLLRWAEAELKKSASKASEQMEIPDWADLTEDERAVAPPLVLFGETQEFGGRSLSQLLWLLKSGLPVKVIVVSDLNFGLDSYGYHGVDVASTHQASHDLSMIALFQENAYVAQSAISAPEHMNRVINEALRYSGPALIQIHAPSPGRHGFAATETLLQAQRAVDARANPLFSANPLAEGLFGSRISLEGNDDIESSWLATNDESSDVTRWSAWALNESRFDNWFRAMTDDDPAAVSLADYLELDDAARTKKSATIESNGETYLVEDEMVAVVEQSLKRWRTLQELAGIVTPFTAAVRARAEQDIAEEHLSDLNQQQQKYEQQIAEIQQNFKGETAQKLRESLMSIAGYNPNAVNQDKSSEG